jgi:hypothetical protein
LRFWLKAILILGLIVVAACLVAIPVARLFDRDLLALWSQAERPTEARLLNACVKSPLLEELLYRAVLCAPLVALLGRKAVIVVSGLVFAWLHVRYGNPSPDNAVAGFLLGWAYLRSGSLLVPITLHALGNLAVLGFEYAMFLSRT